MSSHADTIRLAINVAGAEGHLVAGAWDSLDALLAENQRLREAATDCLLQWAQGRGIPPRLTSEEVALRDALGLDMEIFGDEHRRSLGPFGEALAGDAE